ncbi:MAG: glycerol-3-phosphate acyltransferase [Candidatus Acidiferrales bacterium]
MTPSPILVPLPRTQLEILSVAYLLGSIPFARLFGQRRDPGAPARLATFILDVAKGYAAVWLAARLTHGNIHWMTYSALAVIVGHMFPVWLGFKGRHSVATAAGAFILICWQAVALAAGLWIVVVWFWGYASLGSLAAAGALPLLLYLLYAPRHAPPTVVSASALLVTALLVLKHRLNIHRLMAGTEPRFSLRRPKP